MAGYCDERKRILPDGVQAGMSVRALIEATFLAYNSGRIRDACRLFCDRFCRDDVQVGMSLTGALTPAGLGLSAIVPLMRSGAIDWIVSTGANLYHDLHFSLSQPLYAGSPHLDDTELRTQGIVRIYDIVFSYEVLLNTDSFVRTVCAEPEFQREMGTAEFHWLLGRYAVERERALGVKRSGILATAHELDIPIYCPSPGDSSIGMNVAALALQGRGPRIDPSRDVNESAALVYGAKRGGGRSAVCIVGGGSPKNFLLQTEPHIQEVLGLDEAGHDYFIQITDARPDTGGLSGATPSEAVSWGKIDPSGLPDTVVVYADSTIVLPLLSACVLEQGIQRPHRRLYRRRSELVEELSRAVRPS